MPTLDRKPACSGLAIVAIRGSPAPLALKIRGVLHAAIQRHPSSCDSLWGIPQYILAKVALSLKHFVSVYWWPQGPQGPQGQQLSQCISACCAHVFHLRFKVLPCVGLGMPSYAVSRAWLKVLLVNRLEKHSTVPCWAKSSADMPLSHRLSGKCRFKTSNLMESDGKNKAIYGNI